MGYNGFVRLTIIILLIFVTNVHAKGMIFSLGGGNWTPATTSKKINGESALGDFSESKFIRLSHEGVISANLLYVVSAGFNLTKAMASYEHTGENSTSSVTELESTISMAEARLGFKYNLGSIFYLGAGGILGDFQIDYDRDDYIDSGADTANYKASENQNYVGHYYEAGIMLVAKNFGVRFGAEANSATMQKDLETLSETQPTLNSTKVYMEILWKN